MHYIMILHTLMPQTHTYEGKLQVKIFISQIRFWQRFTLCIVLKLVLVPFYFGSEIRIDGGGIFNFSYVCIVGEMCWSVFMLKYHRL